MACGHGIPSSTEEGHVLIALTSLTYVALYSLQGMFWVLNPGHHGEDPPQPRGSPSREIFKGITIEEQQL